MISCATLNNTDYIMGSDFDFSLTQAANEAGVHRSTVLRKIKAGKLSAQKDEDGEWRIDPAEFYRVYPKRSAPPPDAGNSAHTLQSNAAQQSAIAETGETLALIRQMIDAAHTAKTQEIRRLEETIEDLRNRLDKASAQNRALTQMITDGRECDEGNKKRFWGMFS